jgi:hypothetical protein
MTVEVSRYSSAQEPAYAKICAKLQAEIDAALPSAISKIWHGSPVWFIGENPVVGFSVASKQVRLLFWSGQLFGDPALQPAGKSKAAQAQFSGVSEIDVKSLRRWLKKAATEIWDYSAVFAQKKVAAKTAKAST